MVTRIRNKTEEMVTAYDICRGLPGHSDMERPSQERLTRVVAAFSFDCAPF